MLIIEQKSEKRNNSTGWLMLKRHSFPDDRPKKNMWVFTTLDPSKRDSDHTVALAKANYEVKYVANVTNLERLGHFMAWEYQNIFQLTNFEMEEVVNFLRYWDILRICCGCQMSADWRDVLLSGSDFKAYAKRIHHHNISSASYPACEMYDIDMVAMRFLDTNLAKKIRRYPELALFMMRPSEVDGPLTDTYCSQYNKDVQHYQLGFNHRVVNGTIYNGMELMKANKAGG